MRSLSEFTNLYQVQKTLRFELVPQGKTLENIEQKGLIAEDEVRAKSYQLVKKIIDEYHKEFINNSLEGVELVGLNDFKDKYDLVKKDKSNQNVKNFDKIQTDLRKQIVKYFKNRDDFKTLFKKELIRKDLLYWLDDEDKKELVLQFKDFTTYFTGFHKNRENIYTDKPISTAIAYRLIHENLPKHIENIEVYYLIKGKYKDFDLTQLSELAEELDIHSIDKFFTIDFFNETLNQNGIDRYNTFLGGYSEGHRKVKGFNEITNLYRQQKHLKTRELPNCKLLYKQILSDRESISWLLENFEDDNELLDSIEEFYNKQLLHWENMTETYNVFDKIKDLFNHLNKTEFDNKKVYLKNDNSLTNISQHIFSDWGIIHSALEFYYKKNIKPTDGKHTKKYTDAMINWVKKSSYHKLSDIDKALMLYKNENDVCQQFAVENTISKYFNQFLIKRKDDKENEIEINLFDRIDTQFIEVKELLKTNYSEDKNLKQDKKNVAKIKEFLDSILDLLHFVKPFYIGEQTLDKDESFYALFTPLYDQLNLLLPLYNKTRNYLSGKTYSTEKFKLNFENSTLLHGWDLNKETDNTSVLFKRKGLYYLGIMNKKNNYIFKDIPEVSNSDETFDKIVYKLLPGANKMLPKVFFSKSRIDEFNPPTAILENYRNNTHKKGDTFNIDHCRSLIDFFKNSINKHPDWKKFNFDFSNTNSYNDLSNFYREVEQQGYKITYQKIAKKYVDLLVENGKLYLFKIYNKDFSPYSKGTPNLHTIYWRNLFGKNNLSDVVYKLNGEAEIFYRKKSLSKKELVVHKANKPIENKNPLNPKEESVFGYDIIKDRRFAIDKFQFHVPITMNFKADGINNINPIVNDFLKNNEDVSIIGIDRGERHLLYLSLINQKGEILKQESLNIIGNKIQEVDYHQKLDKKEKERDHAKKSWDTIENIKELKEGYLSHVIHRIAKMMIEHNAIVVMEDLNFGFKRGRFKVEKQVYQKFEKMLIDKLNYSVFKDKDKQNPKDGGGSLRAYQLTNKFISFKKMGKQNGFIFYVPAALTSKIDPTTGFVNFLYPRYESLKTSREFFKKFDSIKYNCTEEYFEFTFDYNNFTTRAAETQTKWTICTTNVERFTYNRKLNNNKGGYEESEVTQLLKELFENYSIKFDNEDNIIPEIIKIENVEFYKKLTKLLSITVSLRHNNGLKGEEEKDYILSPVCNKNGEFFNSQHATEDNPKDADANGAYHIALKGLWIKNQIDHSDNLSKLKLAISNQEWLQWVQQRPFEN